MIKKDMIIDGILFKNPELEKVFKRFGIKCFGWGGAIYMTVEQAAQRYGINLDEILDELNNSLDKWIYIFNDKNLSYLTVKSY